VAFSYVQKCIIICMFEGAVNSAAALFSESMSSQVKLVFNPFLSNVAIKLMNFYIIILELNMTTKNVYLL